MGILQGVGRGGGVVGTWERGTEGRWVVKGVYNDGTRSRVRIREGWCERAAANHDAACCCNGCLVNCIIGYEVSQGIAGFIVQFQMAGMGFHSAQNALQVGVGRIRFAMNDRWGCQTGG